MKFILLITAILLTLFATGSQSRADELAQQAQRVLAPAAVQEWQRVVRDYCK